MSVRVADYIAAHLQSIGVKDVFLLSGGGMMHLLDGLGRVEGLKIRCNHHEQACAFAADAYARQRAGLGVCYATSGPGATNILTGLVGAWQDSTPVLFITGQSKVSQTIRGTRIPGLRQAGVFEVDIVAMAESVTKYTAFLDEPAKVRYHLERAIHTALHGRPGPVLLDIPLDIQGAPVDPGALEGFPPPEDDAPRDLSAVDSVLERLEAAQRPLLLGGYGIRCAKAVPAFRALADALGAPVVTTQLGKDVFPCDHPLFVGHPGPKGDRPGNFALQNADLILSLGCSLHVLTTGFELEGFAPNAHKILVDPDPAVLAREHVGVQEKIQCDVGLFARSLHKTIRVPHACEAWRTRCAQWKNRYAVRNEPHVITEGPVNFYEFAEVLSQVLKGDETIVTDAGSAFYVMGQAFRLKGDQRYIVSGSLGSMGFALPASIGVCAADPNRMAICVTGDGSLQTNIHELETMRLNRMNLKLFVINNDGYVSIRNTQLGFFGGPYFATTRETGVSMPPLDKLAAAYGLPYIDCANRAGLRAALEECLAAEGPVVCGITAQEDQQIIPTVSSVRLPNGQMQSKPLHDMFPFMAEDELQANMRA